MLDYVSWLCNHIRFYFTISYLSGICYCRTFSQTGFQVKILEFMHLIPSKIFNPCMSRVTDRFCPTPARCQNIIERESGLQRNLGHQKNIEYFSQFPSGRAGQAENPRAASGQEYFVSNKNKRVCVQVYLTTGLFVIVSWISFIVPPEVVPGRKRTKK